MHKPILFILCIALSLWAQTGWQDEFADAKRVDSLHNVIVNASRRQAELDRQNPPQTRAYAFRDSTVAYLPSPVKETEYPLAFPQSKGTVEFWVNGNFTQTAGIGSLFDSYDAARNNIVIRSYGLYNRSAQIFFMDTAVKKYTYVSNFDPIPNAWNHIAVTWDMAVPEAKLYVNGNLMNAGKVNSSSWRPSGQKVVVGQNFAGQIEHLRILSIPLSASQIQDDFSAYFALQGFLVSEPIVPAALASWGQLSWTAAAPAGTSIRLQVEALSNGSWGAVSESVLPGNTAGFSFSPVSLSALGKTYDTLRLKAELQTADSTVTPMLDNWSLSWISGLSHPRVYLTPEKIAFLKDRVSRNIKPYSDFFADIHKSANATALKTPPSRSDVLRLSDAEFRAIANPLPDLALTVILTDSVKYWNTIQRWVDSILIYPNWAANRDLGAAHTVYNLAIVYDWLYSRFSANQRLAIESKLALHADTLDQEWRTNNSYLQNHNYVNMGAIMTAGVALYDAAPGADQWVKDAYANFTAVLPLLSPDGVGIEEIPYWGYGVEALLRYFALEESFLGQDRISGNEWFRNTWNYRLHNSIPGFWNVTYFGDSPNYDWYGPGYILQRLASKFNNPYAQWLAFRVTQERVNHRLGSAVDYRNMIWYDSSVAQTPVTDLPTSYLFENTAQFTSRSSWTDSNAFFFAAEAGPPMGFDAYTKINFDAGCGHQHPDKGHFLVNAFNHFLVTDDGYTYLKRTAGHNLITFDNGKGQLGGEVMWFNGNPYTTLTRQPSFIHTEFADHFEYLVADLAPAYPTNLKLTRYLRHFLLIDKKALLVIDEVEADTTHQLEWRLNTDTLAALGYSNRVLTMRTADRKAGFSLYDLSPLSPDSVYTGRFTQSDTFKADPEHGYPNDIIHYASTQQFQMIQKSMQARFDALIIPFPDSTKPDILARRTTEDSLIITYNLLEVRIHTPTQKVQVITPDNPEEATMALLAQEVFSLSPNPFNPSARISFTVSGKGPVVIKIFNVMGKVVREYSAREYSKGIHSLVWDGRDNNGRFAAGGVYFIKLELGSRIKEMNAVLLR